jgi:hypothetical protein
MPRFRTSSHSHREFDENGRHRFEHWYRDNTVYFITAKCRDGYPAFETDEAKLIFFDRFDHYANEFGYVPWVTTAMNNHYHSMGFLRIGENLGKMMQRLHGSVSKLVNDILPERRRPFFRDGNLNDYFDGCIRDPLQCRRAYKYTLTQCSRHKICASHLDYPFTHVNIELERGIARAMELKAFLHDVRYPRYGPRRR